MTSCYYHTLQFDLYTYTDSCKNANCNWTIIKGICIWTYKCMWLDLWKPIQIAQKLKSILFLNINATLLHYPETPNTWLIDGHVCFHRRPFAVPVIPLRCTIGSLGPVNGINKDASGAGLLTMTVLTYPVDWVSSVTDWRHSTTSVS